MTLYIYPAGSVLNSIVIEPIGNYDYVYCKTDGKRGIVTANWVKDDDSKKTLYWELNIDGERYIFQGKNENERKPLKRLLFSIPAQDRIQDWVEYKITAKNPEKIVKALRRAIKTCLDLPQDYYYDIAMLIVLQSWVIEILTNVFYGGIAGGFGGGKTASLEVFKSLMKHGCMVGDITNAGVARTCSKYKLSLCYDEIDSKNLNRDNELLATLRQGQRRGNAYLRLHQKTFEEEVFDIFGSKVYTMHSDIERALTTRTLMINIGETDDKRLPIINSLKTRLLAQVHDDLFFWYMENVAKIPALKEDEPIILDDDMTPDQIRQYIYDAAIKNLGQEQLDLFAEFTGRNIELIYTALVVSKIFGVDLTSSLRQAFTEKKSAELDYDDDVTAIIKEALLEAYGENSEYVARKDLHEKVNIKRGSDKLYPISTHRLKKDLRNLGFVDGTTMKKKRIGTASVLCLFFDRKVKSKLGINTETLEQ